MFSDDPTDDEIALVAGIWRAAHGVPTERSLMILMSAVTLLIAESNRPSHFWNAVRLGVEYRCKEQLDQSLVTNDGPCSVQ